MNDIQHTPITEFYGVCNSTHTDGLTSSIEVYVPDFVPWDKCCPDQKKDFPVGVKPQWQCPGGKHEITKKKTIIASFLGANNQIIPCVHKGERIRVLNFGGDEHYFWLPLGRDPSLRRHEKIMWFAMSQPTAVTAPDYYVDLTDDNCYFARFDTNGGQKHFRLHTNKLETEYRCYDFVIKPEEGEIWLFDSCDGKIGSRKNWLHLQSKQHLWHWENEDGSFAELNKENINVFCKDTYTLHACKNIVILGDLTYKRVSPDQTIEGKNRTSTLSASDTVITKAEKMQNTTFAIDTTTMAINCGGNFSLKAAMAIYTAHHSFMGAKFECMTSSGVFAKPFESHLLPHLHAW